MTALVMLDAVKPVALVAQNRSWVVWGEDTTFQREEKRGGCWTRRNHSTTNEGTDGDQPFGPYNLYK